MIWNIYLTLCVLAILKLIVWVPWRIILDENKHNLKAWFLLGGITIGIIVLGPVSLSIFCYIYFKQKQGLKILCNKYCFDIWEYSVIKDENKLKELFNELDKTEWEIRIFPFKKTKAGLMNNTFIKTPYNIFLITIDFDDEKYNLKLIK